MDLSTHKREREEDARERNRKEIHDRPKQWETVGSESDDDEKSDSKSNRE